MRASKTKSPLRGIAIILLGRPGSGKDTQAELLAEKFGLISLVSSKLLERAFSGSKRTVTLEGKIYDVAKEHRHMHGGALVNFNFVSNLVNDEIRRVARSGKGLIMSASPRSKTEAKKELPLLHKLYGDKVFIFHVYISPREVYVRNLKRHRKDLPELDTREIIKKRLDAFNRYTLPVIRKLEREKKIIEINGEQKIMKIHKDILKILLSKLK